MFYECSTLQHAIEKTRQSIFIANLLTGFYMICCRTLESIEIKGNIDTKSFHADGNYIDLKEVGYDTAILSQMSLYLLS